MINWVDKASFLQNMDQVMATDSLLVIYDFWITDRMVGNDDYTRWYQREYLLNFPKPLRKENVWTREDVGNCFRIENQVTYEMQHDFDRAGFIDFMMIQSNVNAQIESGIKSEEDVRKWMEDTLVPIFKENRRTLIFQGYSWYLKHI